MPTQVVNTLLTTPRFVTAADPLVVTRDGAMVTGSHAINGNDDHIFISVSGQVTSVYGSAITLGGLVDSRNLMRVSISDTGLVESSGSAPTVHINRDGADIANHGTISATYLTALQFGDGVEVGELTNTGTISGGVDGSGVYFRGDSEGTTTGYLNITNTGTITGGYRAIYVLDERLSLVNSGTIASESDTIHLAGGTTSRLNLVNSGTITAEASSNAIVGGQFLNLIKNTGDITGRIRLADGADVIENSGTILGQINTYDGTDIIRNQGQINGDVYTREGTDTIENSGKVHGDIDLGDGHDVFVGLGGYVSGEIDLGSGNDRATVDQDGADIEGGSDFDTVNAYGDVDVSNVERVNLLGSEDITVTSTATSSLVSTTVNGNSGDNTLTAVNSVSFYGAGGNDFAVGSHFNDLLRGHSGNDTLSGGGGNDTLTSERGDDEIEGGSGNDNMSGGLGHDFLDGGSGDDTVIGGEGRDTLYGDAGDDLIWGGAGADDIMGSSGNDILVGHRGNDTLNGGEGADVLTGGAGADVFVWSSAADAGLDAQSDIIKDFKRGLDIVDLSEIGDGSFKFLGKTKALTGTGKMEAKFVKSAGEVSLVLDIDGDGSADARIQFEGIAFLTASDFIL